MSKKSKSFIPADKAKRRAAMLNSMGKSRNSPISYDAQVNPETGEGRVVQLCSKSDKAGNPIGNPLVVGVAY